MRQDMEHIEHKNNQMEIITTNQKKLMGEVKTLLVFFLFYMK